jgi:hypothetical protein
LRLAFPLLAAAVLWAAGARADTIQVTTLDDNAPPDECELDEAILSANTDFGVGGCDEGDGDDLIVFDSGLEGALDLDGPLPEIAADLTIRGRGARTIRIDGGLQHQPFVVQAGVSFTLEDIRVANGSAGSGDGGAIRIQQGADVVLRDCRIQGSLAANGGGIDAERATVRIERCQISGNEATGAVGGVRNRGGVVTLINSTLSANVADQGGGIAGVDSDGPGTTALYSVTLAENDAVEGANVFVGGDSEVSARHAILARPVTGEDCDGLLTSLDWNLADDPSCGLDGDHDLEDVAARLVDIADNGGPTNTFALQPDSPALDGGDLVCTGPSGNELDLDQRGFPRRRDGDGVGGSYCDIGAYEAPEPGAAAAGGIAALALATLARWRRP